MVTWGTSPQDALPITDVVPDPANAPDENRREAWARSLAYMGLTPGTRLVDVPIDRVFIGSCTNGRIEDLRAAAEIARGRKVAPNVSAMVVPGSGLVKAEAEKEGLDKIFLEAGFEWRIQGCSMCLAMNADRLEPGQRCASTSNRNFEGRQGRGGRTHLVSPAMAAAAAIQGHAGRCARLPIAGPERPVLTSGRCSDAPPDFFWRAGRHDESAAAACLARPAAGGPCRDRPARRLLDPLGGLHRRQLHRDDRSHRHRRHFHRRRPCCRSIDRRRQGLSFIAGSIIVMVLALLLINWLYEALMTSSPRGATLGKQALGLRIVRADGTQLSFGRATARHFLKFMITPLVPLAIGYLMAAFTDRKRALHDVLAETLVIRSP